MCLLNENPVPIRDRMPGLAKELTAVIDKAPRQKSRRPFPGRTKTARIVFKVTSKRTQ